MIPIPEQYVVQKFYECVSHATHIKYTNTYNGSCPFCKEGKSFGKRKRFYYLPDKEVAYCHNCGYSKKVFGFLQDLTGLPFNIIISEIKKGTYDVVPEVSKETTVKPTTPSLPDDCINLSDNSQLEFHKNSPIVVISIKTIKDRRLDTAINRPKTYYVSLTDKVHKNRLVLPFYNSFGDIIYYQTRTLLPSDAKLKPKYLSKVGAERSLSGLHNIDSNLDKLFIFEGPIDSYFIKNGLAVCGITEDSNKDFTELQRQQLAGLPGYEKVWCLDNQWNDKASLNKSFLLSDTNEKIFIWPEELKGYKDVNEYCVKNQLDSIDPQYVLSNTFSGLKAKIILTKIKNSVT